MSNALKTFAAQNKAARTNTPVDLRTPGRNDEVVNNTGGFTFEVSDKSRLERFLILGTDGGTYYVGESKLTLDNARFVTDLIKRNEALVVSTLADVARNNRAAKNGPSIFTLALLLTEANDKAAVRAIVNDVVRTSTHLFEFANYIDSFGGWGRSKRSAIAEWYKGKTADQLAYQAVKYRQREGWTHRDLFRKVHPVGVDKNVGNFILGRKVNDDLSIIEGFTRMQKAGNVKQVITLLEAYKNLPWETIPTQFLKEPKVWKTLFYNGGLGQTALLRNVTRFAKIGAFDDMVFAGDVAEALADADRIAKGRVHPVAYANARGIYANGQISGDLYYGTRVKDWTTNPKIISALEAGFYNAFGSVEPARKATMVSVDVSASMTWGAPAGLVGLNYLEAAALMAMVAVRTEPYVVINAFASDLQQVDVSASDSMETVIRKFRTLRMGATNISAPMQFAKDNSLEVDTFAVYTDNEVNCGIKPTQALVNYRKASGKDARLAVFALAGTLFTVADPTDSGQMDFVGFDAAAPRVFTEFSAGRI